MSITPEFLMLLFLQAFVVLRICLACIMMVYSLMTLGIYTRRLMGQELVPHK